MKKRTLVPTVLGLITLLLAGSAIPTHAAANEKTVTETKTSSKTMTCPKAAKTQTKQVSSTSTAIKGTDKLYNGNVIGKYTGTKKTVVTDHFQKGKTTKTRKIVVTTTKNYTMTISPQVVSSLMTKVGTALAGAWKSLGFSFLIQAKPSGMHTFQSKNRTVLLGAAFSFPELYYMMGHFLSMVSGNTGASAAFRLIYTRESARFPGANKAIFQGRPTEYFAACVQQYYTNGALLKQRCPASYAAVQEALSKVTPAQIALWKGIYRIA